MKVGGKIAEACMAERLVLEQSCAGDNAVDLIDDRRGAPFFGRAGRAGACKARIKGGDGGTCFLGVARRLGDPEQGCANACDILRHWNLDDAQLQAFEHGNGRGRRELRRENKIR